MTPDFKYDKFNYDKVKDDKVKDDKFQPTEFKPVRFIFVILLIMLGISQAIKWYSQSVTLPRFCEDPELALHHLEEIVSKRTAIIAGTGAKSRKPYLIAAKLIYLVPQKSNEKNEDYIQRVRADLSQRCMQ